MIFNIHNSSNDSSFSLPYRESDTLPPLLSRIADKAGLPSGEKIGQKDGWKLGYSHGGKRFALDDEDDFGIFLSRYPPKSTDEEPDLYLVAPSSASKGSSTAINGDKSKKFEQQQQIPSQGQTTGGSKKVPSASKPAPQHQDSPQHQLTRTSNATYVMSNPLISHLPTHTSKPSPIPTPLAPPPPMRSSSPPASVRSKSGKTQTPAHLINHPPHHHLNQVSHPSLTNTQLEPDRRSAALALAQQQKEAGKSLTHKKEWEEFHGTNGVRTIMGSIGPVENVRMLMKAGYKHVYLSRKFALANGFIPKDAAPGWYGYGGLVNLGRWPIKVGSKTQTHSVMLSEEVHFDVILGRSWQESMGIKTDPLDQTNVMLMGSGGAEPEKIPCDVVLIKDGRGEHVTVT